MTDDKISEVDALRFQLAASQLEAARLRMQLAEQVQSRVHADLAAKYQLTEADSIDSATGAITRGK